MLLIPLAVCGCNDSPTITLTTRDQSFTQTFTNSYCSITAGGDDVVVLVDDPHEGSTLQHVLRIRMLWHPVNGAKPNSPASTNAALHFFVTDPSSTEPCYIHYAGTGFVTVEHDGPTAEVRIRNATLARLESRGPIGDPLQKFNLSGDFKATLDGHKVDAVLADLTRSVPKNIVAPTTSPSSKIPLP